MKITKFEKSKGQTFVEFLLVFLVLFVATIGVLSLYKTAWKNRYINTSDVSEATLLSTKSTKGRVAKTLAMAGGYSRLVGGYVK